MQTLVALTRGVSPRISECELTFIERQVIDYPRAVQQHRQYQQFLIDSNWQIQQINPGSGTIAYSCSVGVAPDGRPQVTWYQERTANDLNYLHLKYAILQDGRWLAKTIDFDAQTGKWHQMLLDSAGHPHIAYDAFVKGEMRYAYSEGNTWKISRVDSRELGNGKNWNVGMGNSLALDDHGNAYITYYHSDGLYYARQTGTSWSIVKVDDVAPLGGWLGYRSSLVLNSSRLLKNYSQ